MSDTAPRNPVGAPQMLADALLRSVAGTSALLRVASADPGTGVSEVGIMATSFVSVKVSPVVMRRLRPTWKEGDSSSWELLVSASSVEQQVNALDLASAQSLFAVTMAVSVGEQDFVIESVASNEAFGQVYMYRLLLREARPQAL